MESKRVLLIEPGDVLLIGGIGHEVSPDVAQGLAKWASDIGVQVALFAEDIDIDVLKADRA